MLESLLLIFEFICFFMFFDVFTSQFLVGTCFLHRHHPMLLVSTPVRGHARVDILGVGAGGAGWGWGGC
jgi:hypothetical protein